MAMMIHHHAAIIRGAAPMLEHNEYPKHMVHPAFQPATLGTEVKSQSGYSHWVGGTAIRLAPVLVHTEDQEEYYAAKGYVSQGKSDPDAFTRAHAAGTKAMSGYAPQEYPKWAGGVLVNNREEEDAALGARRQQLGLQPLNDATPAAIRINDAAPESVITPSALGHVDVPSERLSCGTQASTNAGSTKCMTNDATQAAMITINEADWVAERTNAGERSAVQARIAALEASLAEIKAMLTLLTGAPTAVPAATAASSPPLAQQPVAMTRGQKGWATRQIRKAGAVTPATRERPSQPAA